MQKMHWLESHLGSIGKAIEFANDFLWNLSLTHDGEQWYIKSNEQIIFQSASRELVDAFLYGMGLAYEGTPDWISNPILDELREVLKHQHLDFQITPPSMEEVIRIGKLTCWNFKIIENPPMFYVIDGEPVIYSSDSIEGLTAFMNGMGLGLMGLPNPYQERIIAGVTKWCEELD
ncbi:MAG: hypothetical protein F9K46_09425 [Anaerolineae bacterium]|nr:MAG: hypothetical protein F9K46_09425 [Anaerolineae bacterium]